MIKLGFFCIIILTAYVVLCDWPTRQKTWPKLRRLAVTFPGLAVLNSLMPACRLTSREIFDPAAFAACRRVCMLFVQLLCVYVGYVDIQYTVIGFFPRLYIVSHIHLFVKNTKELVAQSASLSMFLFASLNERLYTLMFDCLSLSLSLCVCCVACTRCYRILFRICRQWRLACGRRTLRWPVGSCT